MDDRSIEQIISENKGKRVADTSDDAKILLEFLNLIVDIKYRHKYGNSVANQNKGNYSEVAQSNVLTDQVSPVDNGLSGHSRRELFDL